MVVKGDDDDELDELLKTDCLPYGFFYNDNVSKLNHLQKISSLPSSVNSSPIFDTFPSSSSFANNNHDNGGLHHSMVNTGAEHMISTTTMATTPANSGGVDAVTPTEMMVNMDDVAYQEDFFAYANESLFEDMFDFKEDYACLADDDDEMMLMKENGIDGPVQCTLFANACDSNNANKSYAHTPTNQGNASMMVQCPDMRDLHQQTLSPLSGPTLTQLNLNSIKEEEEEVKFTLNDQSESKSIVSYLASGNVLDLNEQQYNSISSTSSPTIKSTLNYQANSFDNCWFFNNGSSLPMTNNSNAVSSTDDCMLDDASLEIESIFKEQPASSLYHANLVSPPQLSSSLPSQSMTAAYNNKLTRPNFVVNLIPQQQQQQQQPQPQETMLAKMLTDQMDNIDYLLQKSEPLMETSRNMNEQLILEHQNKLNFPVARGKMINCPTLESLMATNGPVFKNPLLSSTSASSLVNKSNGMTPIHTFLNNSNRNRNNSMSTDYSVSSHDEGFASQPDEESEESDNDNLEEIIHLGADNNEINLDGNLILFDSNQSAIGSVVSELIGLNSNGSEINNLSMPSLEDVVIKQEHVEEATWMNNNDYQQINAILPSSKTSLNEHPQQQAASASSMIDDNESVNSDEEDDDDESFYGDYDASDLLGASTSDDVNNKWSLNMGRSRKGSEKRYFWQYNVQSKGPKGPRLGSSASFDNEEDPHVFREVSDPVFAPDCQVEGVKHSGKARRGDGNDLTPNPKKLLMIGLELKKLSKTINDLTPVTDVPLVARNKSRKEKNKLASRACRLKKKAQHEANKIKLQGLHREHGKLLGIIHELRRLVAIGRKRCQSVGGGAVPFDAECTDRMNKAIACLFERNRPKREISGQTAQFVNHVLDNVSLGISNGGIDNI